METLAIPNITELLFQGTGILLFKIPILILIFIYAIFLFIVINRINAFNRVINIVSGHASKTLQLFAIFQFMLALSLFFIALVIV